MTGNGSNKVAGLVARYGYAVVITSTNFNARGMHEQTDTILTDYILAPPEK